MGDLSRTAQGILSRIEIDSRINKNNKKYINDFIIFLQAKGAKRATTEKYIYLYEKPQRHICRKIINLSSP